MGSSNIVNLKSDHIFPVMIVINVDYTTNSLMVPHISLTHPIQNNLRSIMVSAYSKTCLRGHSKRTPKLVFKTDYRLMQVKSIAECSKGSILQYFQPSISYHLSLRSVFCLFLSGRLRQVSLYNAQSVDFFHKSVNPNGMKTYNSALITSNMVYKKILRKYLTF